MATDKDEVKPDPGTIRKLQEQKFQARERLREARREMGQLDHKLFKVGATLAEIGAGACW